MERDISLVFLWKTLKKCWLIMMICALVVAIITGAMVSLTPPTYSSKVDFYTKNNDYNTDYVTQSNLGATQQLINDYVDLIQSEKVLSQVCDKLSSCEDIFNKSEAELTDVEKATYTKLKSYTPDKLRSMISASSKEFHSTFTIKVTASSPAEAYYIARAIEEVAPEAVTKIAKSGYLTTEYISKQVAEVIRRLGNVDGLDWSVDKNDTAIQKSIDQSGVNITREDVKKIMTAMENQDEFTWKLNESEDFEELVQKYLNENTSLLKDVSLCFTSYNSASKPSKNAPSIFNYAAISALATAIIVDLIYFIKGLMNTSISSEDDIKRLIDRPVIGVVPHWESASKK